MKSTFYSNRTLEAFANKPTTLVTLRQLAFFGKRLNNSKLIQSANYLRNELAIRLAHRIRAFQNLPFIVGTNPHIESIYDLYWEAFETFQKYPQITTLKENDAFCQTLSSLLAKHKIVIQSLSLGIKETSAHLPSDKADRFVNEMLKSRIGRRVLAQQHLLLSKESFDYGDNEYDRVGIVDSKCDAEKIVKNCVSLASGLFRETYNQAPPNIIIESPSLNPRKFTYISSHIEYILFEAIKNSMTSTLFKHSSQTPPTPTLSKPLLMAEEALACIKKDQSSVTNPDLPSIKITIGQGNEDIMFRISDQGGGIPKELVKNVWSFWHVSTLQPMLQHSSSTTHLGMGLSLSKAYADYWGGNIGIQNMNGFGTDVYVQINTGNSLERVDSGVSF